MLEQSLRECNENICRGIREFLGLIAVKSNSTAKLPPYPFVSFTVLGVDQKKRTYSDDGTSRYIPAEIRYSFTVQSKEDYEAFDLVQKLHDWFCEEGAVWLKDNGLVFTDVGSITERDNLLTIEYEYRKGFDCILQQLNRVQVDVEDIQNYKGTKI